MSTLYVVSSKILDLLAQVETYSLASEPMNEQVNYIIVDVNESIVELDEIIKVAFADLRARYAARFPELETVNISLLEYARCVILIGDSPTLSNINFSSLMLSPSAIMILSMCSTTTTGKAIDKASLDRSIYIANFIISALDAKSKLLNFIERQMSIIAPSLSAIIGSSVAAQLIGASGGLRSLSTMPSGNIQVLGSAMQASKLGIGGDLAGFSKSSSMHSGFISQCDILRNINQSEYKIRAIRLVSGKCALAARYDADHFRENLSINRKLHPQASSKYGVSLRAEIEKKIEKMLEPPPIQKPKPLAAPKEHAKQRRGGKRVKKQRESVAITEMRRLQNRMTFGTIAEDEIIYGDETIGLGQVKMGDNREGIIDAYSKIAAPKANNKAREALLKKGREVTSKFSFTSGIISSLSISNGQGIQLQNPEKPAHSSNSVLKGILTSTKLYSTK